MVTNCCITAQGFVAFLFTKNMMKTDTKLARVLACACMTVAFPQDGGSNGFSHLKIIHFHQRITHSAH